MEETVTTNSVAMDLGVGVATAGKPGVNDGPVANYIKDDTEEGEVITLNFGGTSWLNNLSNTATPAPDANQWCQFPWEFPQLFMSPTQQLEIVSQYMWWKPESVEVCFSNCQNYTQINTGTTPFMMPTNNGKFCMIQDNEYLVNIGSSPFGLSYADTYIEGPLPPTVLDGNTAIKNVLEIMESWKQGGYYNDSQKFLINGVNTMTYQVRGLQSNIINSGNYIRVMNPSHPNCKQMSMGQGRCIEASWKFKNKYWRCTGEFGTNPIFTHASTNNNELGLLAIRGDEWMGFLMNPKENSSTFNTAGFPIYMPPGVPVSLVANTNFNPSWFISPDVVTNVLPIPLYYASNVFAPFTGAIQDGVLRANFLNSINTSRPQPRLLLHLVPDIGVVGTSGTSNCQFDFIIKWRIRVKRKPLQHGITSNTATELQSGLRSVTGPMMATTNVIPYFLPTYSIG